MRYKRLLVPLFIFVLLICLHSSVLATRGCCSYHGGVSYCDSSTGRYVCADGTYSPSCTCWKQEYIPISPTVAPTEEPTIEPTEDTSLYFLTPTPTVTPTPAFILTDVLGTTTEQSGILWFYLAALGVIALALVGIYQTMKK
jgi:hypothetical protein